MNSKSAAYWKRYLDGLPKGQIPQDPFVEAAFAGSKSATDKLLKLYLEGKKTAGSSLLKDFETAGAPLPKVGNYWVILNGEEEPRCIVKTIRVEIHLFKNIPARVAKAEGEGDLSVEDWKRGHANFFSPFLEKWEITDLNEAEVVVEYFEVVHP